MPACLLRPGGRAEHHRLREGPIHGKGPERNPHVRTATSPRTVGGQTYTMQPVEARLGPHRFTFPANLYYNQTGPLADGGVMLTVFWPDFDAAPPGDRPVRSTQDSRRQVLVELRYIDRVPIQNYLARRSSSEATSAPGSLERRDPVENLALRVAQPERWGLTPYSIDPSLMEAYAKESEAALGRPYVHNPGMEPDWYVARSAEGQLTTFISCDPADRIPDGLVAQGRHLNASEKARSQCAAIPSWMWATASQSR